MKKAATCFVLTLAVSVFLFPAVRAQDEMTAVYTTGFVNPQRTPSVFLHDAHNENAGIEECNVCHHVYGEDGKRVEDESSEDRLCSDCHEVRATGRQPGLMKAFHTNCKGCHQERMKGPIMCGECHRK
jgi:hypothetical protein